MVATEIVENEPHLEVRIISTKGGIKNVAYIADNATSLIVQQTTSSASTANSSSNSLKDIVVKNEDLQDLPGFSEVPKFPMNNTNILHQRSSSTEYVLPNNKRNQKLQFPDADINVEVEVQKVNFDGDRLNVSSPYSIC